MGLTATTFILLLIIPGLQAQAGWSVTFTYSHICAVRGSTVNISCTYTYPPGLRVTSTFWFREDKWINDLKSELEYSGRVESVCENNNKCTLIIRNLTESDSGVYLFRIITNIEEERWFGEPGVSLTVTDLQLIRSSQYLNCGSCSQTRQLSCIWSKNGEKIHENFYYLVPKDVNPPDDYPCTTGGRENAGVRVEAVTCSSTNICAFKGATVDISCTYKYPTWSSAPETFWTREDSGVDLSSNSLQSYECIKERTEESTYPYNYYRNTLRIIKVSESDSAVYRIRIRTSGGVWRITGEPGVNLTVPVSELQIHVRRETADQSRNQTELTCVSQCGDSLRSSYIWYRNDETVGGQTQRKLVLQSTDATGRYSCALSGPQRFRSPPVYAPEGPSVSASPSAEVEQNSSVTLSCSSDANPAANYSWFKDNQSLRGGQHLQIISVQPGDRGFYSCNAANEFGSVNSPARFLGVQYPPKSCSVSASPSAEVEQNSSVTLSCSSDANPAANYSWFKDGEKTPKSSEQNFTITNVRAEDAGTYSCRVWNLLGHSQSTVEVTVVTGSPLTELLQKPAFIGAAVGIFLFGLTGVFVVWFVKKNAGKKPDVMAATREEVRTDRVEEDNLQYASIRFSKEPTDHVEEGGDVEYSNVSFDRGRRTGAAGREDSSEVVYSSVK